MTPFVLGTVVCLGALLSAEKQGAVALKMVLKPLCSLGFLGAAVAAGATSHVGGRWLLVALGFSFVGDVALLGRSKRWFLVGLGAFLLAHLVFARAFFARGFDPAGAAAAAVALTVVLGLVLGWLLPHVKGGMRGPVIAYVIAIAMMVDLAVAAGVAGAPAGIPVGAVLFMVSDIAVARERFVKPGFTNRLWGLPLYYGGQLILAATAGAPPS